MYDRWWDSTLMFHIPGIDAISLVQAGKSETVNLGVLFVYRHVGCVSITSLPKLCQPFIDIEYY